jgi:hypothetical protein
MAMYGYGYRYPRVPRVPLYTDPEYRFKWVRSAVGNRAIAAKSPWVQYLRENKVLDKVCDLLRKAGAEYRKQYGFKESTKKGARQRVTKLQRAIEALKDDATLQRVSADLGSKYNPDYVKATIARLDAEINRLKEIIGEQQVAKGYGLLSGLGYGEGMMKVMDTSTRCVIDY